MNNFQKNIAKKELKQDENVLWAKSKTLKMLDYYIIPPVVGFFVAFYASHFVLSEKIMQILPYFGVAVPDKHDESTETSPDGVNWMGVNDNYIALYDDVNFLFHHCFNHTHYSTHYSINCCYMQTLSPILYFNR